MTVLTESNFVMHVTRQPEAGLRVGVGKITSGSQGRTFLMESTHRERLEAAGVRVFINSIKALPSGYINSLVSALNQITRNQITRDDSGLSEAMRYHGINNDPQDKVNWKKEGF